MNNELNRIGGAAMALLALASLIVTVIALYQVWRWKEPATANVAANLELVDSTLGTTAEGLLLAKQTLETTTTSVSNLQVTVDTLGKSISDTMPLIDTLDVMMGEELPETVRSARVSLEAAQASAKVIDAVLHALTIFNPQAYDPPVPLDQALGDISASMEPLPASFLRIEASLETTGGNMDRVMLQIEQMAGDIGSIHASLEDAQEILIEYEKSVQVLRSRLNALQEKLPLWSNGLAWSVTFALAWLGITQLGVLLNGLRNLNPPG